MPRQTVAGRRAGPVLAIEAFATGYINWRATTVSRTMRALEAISIGQARSEVALAASQTAQDYELRHGGVANSGTVEAVAPVLGHRDQYAVVTRERTTATNTTAYQGLPAAWHLTLATVTRLTQRRVGGQRLAARELNRVGEAPGTGRGRRARLAPSVADLILDPLRRGLGREQDRARLRVDQIGGGWGPLSGRRR